MKMKNNQSFHFVVKYLSVEPWYFVLYYVIIFVSNRQTKEIKKVNCTFRGRGILLTFVKFWVLECQERTVELVMIATAVRDSMMATTNLLFLILFFQLLPSWRKERMKTQWWPYIAVHISCSG